MHVGHPFHEPVVMVTQNAIRVKGRIRSNWGSKRGRTWFRLEFNLHHAFKVISISFSLRVKGSTTSPGELAKGIGDWVNGEGIGRSRSLGGSGRLRNMLIGKVSFRTRSPPLALAAELPNNTIPILANRLGLRFTIFGSNSSPVLGLSILLVFGSSTNPRSSPIVLVLCS
jgi:hypothetical protein